MKNLGGAGGGPPGESGRCGCRVVAEESSGGGGGGGSFSSSEAEALKSYTMLGNFCARNCWRPALESWGYELGRDSGGGGGGSSLASKLSSGGGGR